MTQRYEMTRTTGEEPLMLIFPEGAFEALPFEIRLMGPWYGCSYGDLESLKPSQRIEILRQGYTILRDIARVLKAA